MAVAAGWLFVGCAGSPDEKTESGGGAIELATPTVQSGVYDGENAMIAIDDSDGTLHASLHFNDHGVGVTCDGTLDADTGLLEAKQDFGACSIKLAAGDDGELLVRGKITPPKKGASAAETRSYSETLHRRANDALAGKYIDAKGGGSSMSITSSTAGELDLSLSLVGSKDDGTKKTLMLSPRETSRAASDAQLWDWVTADGEWRLSIVRGEGHYRFVLDTAGTELFLSSEDDQPTKPATDAND